MGAVPVEARRGHWIPDSRVTGMNCLTWVLGLKPQFLATAGIITSKSYLQPLDLNA